jgi:SAM-dependent methyltransferase
MQLHAVFARIGYTFFMDEKCRICGNAAGNKIHTAREMMFGTRDKFRYIECVKCGTLQIEEIPDLTKYYPPEYYSFAPAVEGEVRRSLKRRIAGRFIANYHIKKRGVIGKRLANGGSWPAILFPEYLKNFPGKLTFSSLILDHGSGSGRTLRILENFGFRSLVGADAFIEKDIVHPGGVTIYKKDLKDLDSSFDLIMLHHVFEHLSEPRETLSQIHRLLSSDGTVIIRMPIVNYAWKKYGVNWVQLDPPRHLFLYTEKAFREMAADAGFEIVETRFDSEAFQFYGSERYLMDIPMNDPLSFCGADERSIFSAKQIEDWTREAEDLNARSLGDQACFYLRKLAN